MEPGGFIHGDDPFATPEAARSPGRRLRGRLVAPVTLWTAAGPPGPTGPAGLTVSSTLIADGDPARVLGLVDEESELWEAVAATGRFLVCPLRAGDQQLADRFAGLLPAPGGLFRQGEWRETDYGPVPAGHDTWAGCRLDQARPVGWSLLVEATLERIELGPGGEPPLSYHRGRYRTIPQ